MQRASHPTARFLSRCRQISVASCCVLVASAAATAQDSPRPTRVLLLYEHAPESPPIAAFSHALRAVIGARTSSHVEYYEEFLDLERYPDRDRAGGQPLARYFADKYRTLGLDVVIAEGTAARRFATERMLELLPGVPVVFALSVDTAAGVLAPPPNVTGRLATLPFATTFAMARQLQPDAWRVVLVGGASSVDSAAVASALNDISMLRGNMLLEVIQAPSYEELVAQLRRLPDRTFVLLASFERDRRGRVFSTPSIVSAISRESSAPVYGMVEGGVGNGLVGGSSVQFADEGNRTGELVMRVLHRGDGEALPAVRFASTPFAVDWRQLRRWGIPEKRLFAGTSLLFRTPTFWERNRALVLMGAFLIGAESVLLLLLLIEHARRKRVQQAREDQLAFERTMSEVTADVMRHAPDDSSRALEDALACVGRYSGASTAVLVQYAEEPEQPPTRLEWTGKNPRANGHSNGHENGHGHWNGHVKGDSMLEVPLVAAGESVGALELYRFHESAIWPAQLVRRLDGVGALLASAMARARASHQAALKAEEARRQVAHMTRVAVVGELAAAVAQELRPSLATIRVSAEAGTTLLERDPLALSEAKSMFASIAAADAHASDVIERIRSALRNQERPPVAVDINDICRHAALVLERDAAIRRVRFGLLLEPKLSKVQGDPAQLQQVVLNLAFNALDAAALSTGQRTVSIGTARRDGEVEIVVRDSGPGLDVDMLPHLFEPFFSTKSQGLGMGLVIVRSIVDRHRGRVLTENGRAGGAVFRVLLPVS